MHWHHTCWNCGKVICAGQIGVPGFYYCTCGVGESEKPGFINTDASYDPDFAARSAHPC